MHRTMSPNLFSYLRLTDTPDIDLLGRDCVQLSPFLMLRSWHCWLECWASSAPALASTQKSLDACLDKCKLALLVLMQDAKTVAPGASWDYQICAELCSSNLCCSTGSLNTHLITNHYLEMLKVIWKILPLQEKKNPPRVRDWCHPTQCLHWLSPSAMSGLFSCSMFAERLKTSSFCSGELMQKLGLLFFRLQETECIIQTEAPNPC